MYVDTPNIELELEILVQKFCLIVHTFYIGTKGNFSELCSQDISSSWFPPKLKLMIGKLARCRPIRGMGFFAGKQLELISWHQSQKKNTFNYSKIHSYIFKVASSLNWNFLRILAHCAPLPFIPTYDELQIISNIYIIYIYFLRLWLTS